MNNENNKTDFKRLYLFLFNAITDIIEEMEDEEEYCELLKKYICRLKSSQINAEELYISQK